MSWDKERIAQLQLPDLADDDPHPRLLLKVNSAENRCADGGRRACPVTRTGLRPV